MRRVLLCTLALAAACARAKGRPAEPPPSMREASAGVESPALKALLERHWEAVLRFDPILATTLGDHRFDALLPDRSAAALERFQQQRHLWLAEARALPEGGLKPGEQVVRELLMEDLEADIAADACSEAEWKLGARDNALAFANELVELHPVKTASDAQHLLARYAALPAYVDTEIANLKRGQAKGWVSTAESIRRVVQQLETQLAQPTSAWPMMGSVKGGPAGWSAEESQRFAGALSSAAEQALKPALVRYLSFVKSELLPIARAEDKSGLIALPFGKVCYEALIRRYVTLPRSAQELHRLGQSEVARIDLEMQALGQKLFATDDLGKVLDRLRSDRALYFDSSEAVEAKAKDALARARAKIPQYFGLLPKADCVVTRIPDHEAPFTTVAYYRQPVPDGSKPGQYFINVYQPETRTRYEAEALAFHEAIPGHHLQIAIAQELPAVPSFIKHQGMTVFIEGWGLYSEQLADEMGLYSSDLDRLGKLSYEAWRASRLVVDTGIHAMGWSRQAAKGFMLAHTALAPNNIDNEVDRYISTPAQALAYKTGQLELLRLRAQAKQALGARFDLKAFHDVVLGGGAVSLPVLTRKVEAWIAASTAP